MVNKRGTAIREQETTFSRRPPGRPKPAPAPADPCCAIHDPSPSGFTLIELMIVMLIIGILATIAVPSYKSIVKMAKEAVLRTDLRTMRDAIESYTYDKQKAPQTLDDLVQGGYLRAIPKDPFTQRNDTWITEQGDMLTSIDETSSGGIDNVHSGAQDVSSENTSYATW